jgi:DNA-binding beta-propeller fold protein YncE
MRRLGIGLALWCLAAGAAAAQGLTGEVVAESDRGFSRPHDVALSPDGRTLCVADVGNDAVKILDADTLATLGAFGTDALSSPHDVAFDSDGRLLVADTGNDRVAVYEVDGTAGRLVGEIRGGLRSPEGVDVAPDGSVYVTNAASHDVVVFRDGEKAGEAGRPGDGENEYVRPHDVEVTDGRVVVADPGNHRLQVLDADLRFVREVGGKAYAFNEPKYLAGDRRGRLFVADEFNNRIVVLDPSYRVIGVIGGGLHHPEGAEVAGDRLWIADTGNHRIVLYRLRRRR